MSGFLLDEIVTEQTLHHLYNFNPILEKKLLIITNDYSDLR